MYTGIKQRVSWYLMEIVKGCSCGDEQEEGAEIRTGMESKFGARPLFCLETYIQQSSETYVFL